MKCSYCDRTDKECRIRKVRDYYLCPKHYTRFYRHSDMNGRSIYDVNDYVLYDDHAEIILRDKDCNEVARALIDLEDVEKCKQYKWHTRKKPYGKGYYVTASLHGQNEQKIHLHRFVLDYCGDLEIDHINRNPLDNRKCNLRAVDHSTNAANNDHTGVKQVHSGRWQASCTRNYKSIYIGTFDTKEEAMIARQNFVAALAS